MSAPRALHAPARRSRPPANVLLLAVMGAALIAAGTALAWSEGAVLGSANPILAAIAWCF